MKDARLHRTGRRLALRVRMTPRAAVMFVVFSMLAYSVDGDESPHENSMCGNWVESQGLQHACIGALRLGDTVVGVTPEVRSAIGTPAPDHFYSMEVTPEMAECAATGDLQISSCGSDFDTWLRVYDAATGEEKASCDDCGDCGYYADLQGADLSLDVGKYVVMVEGRRYYHRGPYVVSLSCAGGDPVAALKIRCSMYVYYPRMCGSYDDLGFSAQDMCCECGGGSDCPTPVKEDTEVIPRDDFVHVDFWRWLMFQEPSDAEFDGLLGWVWVFAIIGTPLLICLIRCRILMHYAGEPILS